MACPLLIVGEAYGEQEEILGRPFVGAAGQLLTSQLEAAGLNRKEIPITNCFNICPEQNNIDEFFRKDKSAGLPARDRGKYVLPELRHHIDKLHDFIRSHQPNLILALGVTALWGTTLLNCPKIGSLRGVVMMSEPLGCKVLATYHPAAVLRQWQHNSIVIADMIKARRESQTKDLVMPKRELWLAPTLQDLETFYTQHIEQAPSLGFDIETSRGQITCISFAPNANASICVPFVDLRNPDYSYWPTVKEEVRALAWCKELLEGPKTKIAQNGLYDVQWIWKKWGIRVNNFTEDTMLLHHAMYPEMPKSLGFLGSIYTHEKAWKLLGSAVKREDT